MKSYLSLSFKELKAQKVMAALILIAVILSSIMTTAVGQSLGILQSMRIEQASSLNGDRYATFHQIKEKEKLQLENDNRLYDVGSFINVGITELGNSGLNLFTREYSGNALNAYPVIKKIKKGTLPALPFEIALPENALPYLGEEIHIGDTITLQARISRMDGTLPEYSYSATYTVCGILESNYIGYSTGTLNAVAGVERQLLFCRIIIYFIQQISRQKILYTFKLSLTNWQIILVLIIQIYNITGFC